MSKGKKKHTPARNIPVSKADVERAKKLAADEGVKLAMVIFLSVLLDKEGYDKERLQQVWKYIEDRSQAITDGYVSVNDLYKVLRDEYEVVLWL